LKRIGLRSGNQLAPNREASGLAFGANWCKQTAVLQEKDQMRRFRRAMSKVVAHRQTELCLAPSSAGSVCGSTPLVAFRLDTTREMMSITDVPESGAHAKV
jgi:hypothetical protein